MLIARKGEYLKDMTFRITDAQIVLNEPRNIEISIWRNDERTEKQFKIQVHMPWGNIYTIACYDKREEAEEEFEKIVRQLKNNKAKLAIGSSFSIIFQ